MDLLKEMGLTPKNYENFIAGLSEEEQAEFLNLLETANRHERYTMIEHFEPYVYQKEFFNAGGDYKARFLMAANRLGKTYGGCVEMTYHLTGNYPEWWEGKTFPDGILAWCVGITGDSTKKVLQDGMFGTADVRFEELMGTGAIPKAAIISVEKDGAAIKSAKIKHCPDGDYENWVNTLDNVSTIEFRSCEQGEATMMGSTVEVIWLDEEHPLHSTPIYAQCITRTATTGGIVIITATPENGLTELIGMFQDTPELYIQNATWDDAPHLDEKTKAELLAALPEWQHDMRSKGIPVMGEGLVYSVAQKTYECEPFEIPMHWKQIAALDVGYAHPTVFSKLAFDPDNDIIYLTYQQGFTKMTPSMIAPTLNTIGRGLPIVWPQDANQASKDTGITLSLAYENLGVALLPQPFKNRGEGSISVEYGVNEILERMKSGRFKVFSHCKEFFTGAQRYQRKDGVINKKAFDFDFGDSARYGALSDFEDWVTGYVKMQNSPLAWSSDSEWDDDSNMNDDHF